MKVQYDVLKKMEATNVITKVILIQIKYMFFQHRRQPLFHKRDGLLQGQPLQSPHGHHLFRAAPWPEELQTRYLLNSEPPQISKVLTFLARLGRYPECVTLHTST